MSDVEVTNEAGVRWIALNRPESKNGLTDAVNAALIEALDGAAADKAIRCVVVTGKAGNFCSGLDLKAMAVGRHGRHGQRRRAHAEILPWAHPRRAPRREAGGGARRRRGGRLRLRPGAGVRPAHRHRAHALRRGLRQARPHARRRRHLDAAAPGRRGQGARAHVHRRHRRRRRGAASWACVTRIIPSAEAEQQTWEFAKRLAAGPPLVHAWIKRAVYAAQSTDLDAALENEVRGQMQLLRSKDFFEGIAAFFQKRDPKFTGE